MEEPPSTAQGRRDWSSLSADLLREVLARLPWSSFAATCAHWRSAVAPFYLAWITPILLNAADVGSTNVRFYSPYYHKNFEIDETMESPGARVCFARGHHVTLYHRVGDDDVLVDANLVTGAIHDLYLLKRTKFDFIVVDDERRIFGVDAQFLEAARSVNSVDGEEWCGWKLPEFRPPDGSEFTVSPMMNPMLHRGLLYLLGVDGRLAVHDDNRHEEGFKILDKPSGFGFEYDDYYLFDSDEGELMAVLVGQRGSPVRVVRLNEQRMEWEKVESWEGRALFTGTLTTLMVKTSIKWMQNKIFTPRLYDWPETIQVDLIDRGGELAFVPVSTGELQHGGTCGTSIWACGLGTQEVSEFWETIEAGYGVWVDFSN